MRAPNLIIPGFPKSGTSSLHLYLNQHSDILMSTIKEPHNYSNPLHYSKRFDDDFKFSFKNILNIDGICQIRGESSTSYMINKATPELIKKDNPNVKFIILARDPIDRIVSHFNWLKSFPGKVKLPFKQELMEWDRKTFDIGDDVGVGYKFYIEQSKYGMQLERYLNYFDRSQFLFLSTEELKINPIKELGKCFNFLGLSPMDKLEIEVANKTTFDALPIVNSRISKYFVKFIPAKTKQYVKNSLLKNKINKLQSEQIYSPTKEEMTWLHEELDEDIALFRKLSGKGFKQWKNFN